MTVQSRTDLQTLINANVNDNTSGDITPADVRAALTNLNDSCLNTTTDTTTFQPLDADLTTIAALTATTNNFLQSKSSAWASRTPTQVTADLIAAVGDSGSGGTKGLVPAPASGDATKFLRGDMSYQTISGGGDALVANPLSQFAATTSLQLKGVISDETGSGALVFATSPTLVTPALGTPASGVATNLTGTASGLTSGAVTNATLTTALTVNTGTLTLTANAANTSVLTVGAGAVSVSGANTGDQTITLTGAVTGSGTGSFATTIATPGTLTVSSTNSTATAHTHAITSSSAPGAAAAILATDSSGIIGSTGTRIVKGWFTDLTVTNAIAGGVTGNAGTVTNATLTTALTVNTGTVTLTGNAANTSALTIGAGAVSVSGANTGDQVVPSNTTSTASNFFTAYNSTTGAFTKAQPAFTDISGTATAAQIPSNVKITSVGFTSFDATAVATGKVKGFFTCPYAGTITGWNIVVDAGTATIKVWKIATGTAKPTSSNSINTSGVAISTGTAVHSSTTSDFTSTTVTANDIFAFNIQAISGVTEITFNLEITKT